MRTGSRRHHELMELTTRRVRHIGERPEWTRREERVARADENAHVGTAFLEEPLHESRLSDSGLAGDEHETLPSPGTVRPRVRREDAGKRLAAFQQRAILDAMGG